MVVLLKSSDPSIYKVKTHLTLATSVSFLSLNPDSHVNKRLAARLKVEVLPHAASPSPYRVHSVPIGFLEKSNFKL